MPSGCAWGIGADLVRNWVARFDTVQIADQVTRDSYLRVSDDALEPVRVTRSRQDVILGGDFLRTHRVLVSRGQRKIYFTYMGGKVFAAAPSTECDERATGKTVDQAISRGREGIAKNPG